MSEKFELYGYSHDQIRSGYHTLVKLFHHFIFQIIYFFTSQASRERNATAVSAFSPISYAVHRNGHRSSP